jgi:hypothetical protein
MEFLNWSVFKWGFTLITNYYDKKWKKKSKKGNSNVVKVIKFSPNSNTEHSWQGRQKITLGSIVLSVNFDLFQRLFNIEEVCKKLPTNFYNDRDQ